MFLSYEIVERLGLNKKTQEYRWRYKIIDSEFEDVGLALTRAVAGEAGLGVEVEVGVGIAVIRTYEKRGLNVAANLAKAFVWCGKEGGFTINELITWSQEYNPKFAKYDKELEKYLVLI